MIDEEWLRTVRVDTPYGKITRLVGTGADNVVFGMTTFDGQEVVVKTRRHHLGYHIKEVPNFLSAKPQYDVDRLNRKLLQLVGNPSLDSMTKEYDRLYSAVMKSLHEREVGGLIMSILTPESIDAIPFILHTPGMKRRLQDLASLTASTVPTVDSYVDVNGPNFRISDLDVRLVEFAKRTLTAIEALPSPRDFFPEKLPENPLYVWGAAVMDGFYTDEELPRAIDFIESKFGRLTEHPQFITFVSQIDALAHLLVSLLKETEVSRLVKLCALAGFLFQVTDRKGEVVADGFKLL